MGAIQPEAQANRRYHQSAQLPRLPGARVGSARARLMPYLAVRIQGDVESIAQKSPKDLTELVRGIISADFSAV